MLSTRESSEHQAIFSVLALAVLLAAVLLTLALTAPPAPLSADAPATEFSAQRAMEDLAVIAQEPHPMGGSPAHAAVRHYILDEIRSLGLEPEVQETFGVRLVKAGWVIAGAVENILVRLPGTTPQGAILLMAHYDSAPDVPGAADNGTGVVTLLEVLRALRASPRLRQDVIFLFTDGHEPGTIGAHAFVSQHPWLDDVGVSVNMEGCADAPPALFTTGPENGTLIRALARSSLRPVFVSLPYHLFPMGDTDVLPFLSSGVPVADIRAAGPLPEVHTALDRPAVVRPASLQHGGSQVLSLARYLADQPALPARAPDETFFPLLGSLVHYPTGWAVPLAIVAGLGFLGVLFYGLRARQLTYRGVGLGLLTVILSIGLSVGIANLAWLAIQVLHPEYGYAPLRPRVSDDFIYAIGFFFLALAITTILLSLARRKVSALDLAAGVFLFWFPVTIAAALLIPATSYVGTWTLLSGSIALGIGLLASSRQETPAYTRWAFLASAILAILLWVPVIYMAFVGSGLPMLSMVVALAAALLTALIPILDWTGYPKRWLLPAAALLVGVGFLSAGHFLVGKDTSPPLVNPIGYWLDADKQEATWITFSAGLDERQSALFLDAVQRSYTDVFPQAPHWPVLACPAPMLDLDGPHLEVVENTWTGGRRAVRMKITTSMEDRVYVITPEGASVLAIAIPHNEKAGLPPCDEEMDFVLRFDGTPTEGFEVGFELDHPGSFRVLVVEERTGLPSFPGLSIQPQPGTMRTPGEFYQDIPTDFTAIYREFEVPGSDM